MATQLKSNKNILQKDIVEEFDIEFNDVKVKVNVNCYFDDFFIVAGNLKKLNPDVDFIDNINMELDKIAKFSKKDLHFLAKLEVFEMIVPVINEKYKKKLDGKYPSNAKRNNKAYRNYSK